MSSLPESNNGKVVIKVPGEDKGRKQIISMMINGIPVIMPFRKEPLTNPLQANQKIR
jgi:hypothetical protein